MFSISCSFDEESGVDIADPFGDIRFTDGRSTIIISNTYLDSWLEALINALKGIQSGAGFTVAIPEEPQPLHIDVNSDGVIALRSGSEGVVAENARTFEHALLVACQSFVTRLSSHDEAVRNPAISAIMRFSG